MRQYHAYLFMAALAVYLGSPAAAQLPFPLPQLPVPFPLPLPPGLPTPGGGAGATPAPFNVPFIAPPLPEVPADSPSLRSITADYGGRIEGPHAKLVAGAMYKVSDVTSPVSPPSGFRVTLLDSPVVNAMAIGEGNIFITRQILALTNSEDELIGILGHEAGHVMARHPSLGALPEKVERGGTSLLALVSPDMAVAAGVGGTLVVRFFDRAKEHQSDVTGTKVLADMGRDPMGMYRAIALLEADEALDQMIYGSPKPAVLEDFLRTHPVSTQRLQLISAAAQMAPRAPGKTAGMSSAEYIRALDGLQFDDGRSEGTIDGNRFQHGPLKLALVAPAGFRLRNTPDALIASGPGGSSAVLAARPDSANAEKAFAAIWTEEIGKLAPPPPPIARTIAGLPAVEGRVRSKSASGPVEIVLTVVRWPGSGVITLLSVDPAGTAQASLASLRASLRRLTAEEADAIPVRRIQVIDATPRDTIASLSARMAYRDHAEARFRVLNALPKAGGSLGRGPFKIVVWSNGHGLP
jgi:predicted Zn-dependent protease